MSKIFTLSECADFLNQQREGRILLAAHIRPDGDALGSLCGMLLLLNENGFSADAILPDSIPDYYRPMLPETGLTGEPSAQELSRYSLMIVMDSARKDRVAAEFFANAETHSLPVLNIDHHPDNPAYADYNLVLPDAASDTEILTMLAQAATWNISPAAAEHLMTGLVTDTGGFRFTNTTARTMRTAAMLREAGCNYEKIMTACFFSKAENLARFEAELLFRYMKKALDGKMIYAYLAPELLEKYDIDLRNTEQVIEILRAMDGPLIAATIRNEQDGFKCSLRSKDRRYSVGRIARAIGGGGHEMAAGCTMRLSSFEEAEKILLKEVENELNEKQT